MKKQAIALGLLITVFTIITFAIYASADGSFGESESNTPSDAGSSVSADMTQ